MGIHIETLITEVSKLELPLKYDLVMISTGINQIADEGSLMLLYPFQDDEIWISLQEGDETMRIAMIGQKGMPSRAGGIEVHVEEIGSRLAAMGHDLLIYARSDYCSALLENYKGMRIIHINNLNTKHFDTITYTAASTLHALKSGAEIIHFHALGPSLFAFLPRLFGRKVICTVHGLDWKREKWGRVTKLILKLGEHIGVRYAHRAISVSETLLPYFEEKYHKVPVYIPNGVYVKPKPSADILFKSFGLDENSYILFLSRIVPEKGLHFLIEAYRGLKTDKKLVIAGGSSHSDPYLRSVMRQAEGATNIVFTGFVEGEVLEALFSHAYLYVLPSTIEGLPISLLEAMSYGTLCLTSDIDENRTVLRDYGFTFRNRDVEDLRSRLAQLLASRDGYDSQKTIEYIRERFTWDYVATQTAFVYESVYSKNNK